MKIKKNMIMVIAPHVDESGKIYWEGDGLRADSLKAFFDLFDVETKNVDFKTIDAFYAFESIFGENGFKYNFLIDEINDSFRFQGCSDFDQFIKKTNSHTDRINSTIPNWRESISNKSILFSQLEKNKKESLEGKQQVKDKNERHF